MRYPPGQRDQLLEGVVEDADWFKQLLQKRWLADNKQKAAMFIGPSFAISPNSVRCAHQRCC